VKQLRIKRARRDQDDSHVAPLHLDRYTSLPVLLDLLKNKRLVLLSPASWEDKNDSEVMLEYQQRRGVENVLAVCFCQGDETVHNWRTFADGISGCRIRFNAEKLLQNVSSHFGVRCGSVEYKKIKELKKGQIPVADMPFIKRWPYRCEEEYRILWEGDGAADHHEISIDLQSIQNITISQKMPYQVYVTIKKYLRQAFKDPEKRISRSTLYRNDLWIRRFKKQ
jgi:hypothetical protein